MKLLSKLIKIVIILTFLPAMAMNSSRGLDGFEWQNINAVKNARLHSNMGNIYFQENNYVSALKEYQIAYNLTYDLSVSSVYLYNMSKCFMKINNYSMAKTAFQGAIEKDYMNIAYYEALVDCFVALGEAEAELQKYLNDNTNPYNRIVAGLIYLKTGQKISARVIFDEFIANNPDMLITNDVKVILKKSSINK